MFSEDTRAFILAVCRKLCDTDDYDELDTRLTCIVDTYGEENNLSPDERDRIQNEIYEILGR